MFSMYVIPLIVYTFIFSTVVSDHWCTYSLSLHYLKIPNMAVYWALLLMDYAEDVMKLKAQSVELCENNHDALRGICTEKQKGTCSFPGRKMYYKCVSVTWISWSSLSIVGRDSSHGPVTWKWQIFFLQTAVLRQFFYGTFQIFSSGLKRSCWIRVGVCVSFFILHV